MKTNCPTLTSLALLTFLPVLSAQQQCAAFHDDGKIDSRVSMGGPNLLLGMKFTTGKTMALDAIDVMTGKRPGQNNDQNPWPAKAWKFRLYCLQTSGSVTVFGKGKPGLGNVVPIVAITGWPAIGSELQLLLSNAAPQSPAVLVLGKRITLPISLGTVYSMPLVTAVLQTSAGRSPGTGGIVLPLRIPDQTVFVGLRLTVQWWIVDTAANQGFSHTAGAEFITK